MVASLRATGGGASHLGTSTARQCSLRYLWPDFIVGVDAEGIGKVASKL
jgi:hypothetical protein